MLSAPVSSLHKTDSGFVQMLAFGRSGREQAHFWFSEHVSSPKIKNISLFQKAKSGHIYRHPVPTRGAYHDRHDRGTGMRWTRKLR